MPHFPQLLYNFIIDVAEAVLQVDNLKRVDFIVLQFY
jgi:hypothetical protein